MNARFILLLAMFPAAVSAMSPTEILAKVSASVLTIRTYSATGSQLAIASGLAIGDGVVISDCAVLENADQLIVEQDGMTATASLVWKKKSLDLCVLKTRRGAPFDRQIFASSGLTLSTSLRVGQDIVAVGASGNSDRNMSTGKISALRKASDGLLVIQTDALLTPDSSGGGLFGDDGRFIGLTFIQQVDRQNLVFARPGVCVLGMAAALNQRLLGPCARPAAVGEVVEQSVSNPTPPRSDGQGKVAECFPRPEVESATAAEHSPTNAIDDGPMRRYASTFGREISKDQLYPILAVRARWSGRTDLRVVIGIDGMVKDLSVLKSSGHDVLDVEAMAKIVRNQSKWPAPPDRLSGCEFTLTLPIIFHVDSDQE